ncbi:D-alanyl-D-alanine carboxypeptidase (penicillin-binding protein 5/6) [Cryobacterium sp. MP_3.1]|uniref:D-alanyl-D-alanine carboxypeptidase family protein n=1 Tax=Cryobacterium sp. MP_3.1 TaxID=3071711 RepID=UPI002DFBFE84|nr:D-alanyl-D-alanine carboxypeptidase (penicillin-binding protein 5/6) [Cryobacterium sp. MP_3.1]
MSRFRPGRVLGISVGTLVILMIGVYGPATLLGPLPSATVTVTAPTSAVPASTPVLPAAGSSGLLAVTAVDDTATDDTATGGDAAEPAPATLGVDTIAIGGGNDPVPMASAAKIITALVVLDAKPLAAGEPGPAYSLVTADYQDYLDYTAQDARTVIVFPGESWTEREMLQAMILGSSNNHADTLARWAFGSVDAYLTAANAWLAANGMPNTTVVDANGLLDGSAGTGTDLARVAGLAATNPVIADIIAQPASALVGQRGVRNTTEYLPEEGITGISRSYTDSGGVCFLFTGTVVAGEKAFTFAGAFLGEPDYDTLTADLTALMASARAGVTELPILAEGDGYATLTTAWGDSADAVVATPKTRFGWQAAAGTDPVVTLDDVTTGRAGAKIGRVTVDAFGESVSSTLELDTSLTDPGPGWRLLHPVPVVSALVASW